MSNNDNGSKQNAAVCSDLECMDTGRRQRIAQIGVSPTIDRDGAYQQFTFPTLYYLDTVINRILKRHLTRTRKH